MGEVKSRISRVMSPRSGETRNTPLKSRSCPGAGAPGSVKYVDPSEVTTTSLGRLRRMPIYLLAMTVTLPSSSTRVTRRKPCSQATSLPCASLVRPLAKLVGSREHRKLLTFHPLHRPAVTDVAPHEETALFPHTGPSPGLGKMPPWARESSSGEAFGSEAIGQHFVLGIRGDNALNPGETCSISIFIMSFSPAGPQAIGRAGK